MSALETAAATQEKTVTVEGMQDSQTLKMSLKKTVQLNEAGEKGDMYTTPSTVEYWDRQVKKMKRITSEPSGS